MNNEKQLRILVNIFCLVIPSIIIVICAINSNQLILLVLLIPVALFTIIMNSAFMIKSDKDKQQLKDFASGFTIGSTINQMMNNKKGE